MFVGLVRDMTEQLQVEAAARKSEAMRAAIIDANLDALVTIDAEDRIIEFSPVAEEMFGHRRETVIGQNMAELLIPPQMREMHHSGMQKYLATGEGPVIGNRIEVPALRANGETFPVELTVQPIDVDGEKFFSALLRDISERKAEEQALLDAKRCAEAASEAKSRFLAHMSHEIRSPLNAVLGSLGLLQDHGLSKDQQLYAKTAEASGRILLSLINDILDFSKIEAGQVALENSEFAVRDLVEETMDLVAFKARDKGLYVAAQVDMGVAARVRGDATRLRQILSNLLDNALKFTDSGAVILTVEQRAAGPEGSGLRFAVEDSGIGIPAEAQASLFDEFQQVDSSDSTRHGGSGLGLSICQGLAELMGGTIGLHSEPGSGSRFWVDIPLAPAQQTTAPVGQTEIRPPLRALAVGFDTQLAAVLHEMCAGAGCDLACANDAQQATLMLHTGVQTLLVDSQLAAHDLDAMADQARGLGMQRVLLLAPAATPQIMQRVTNGQYDDLVLSPLVMRRLAESLRASPDADRAPGVDPEPAGAAQAAASLAGRILLAEDSVANQLVATAILRRQGYTVDVASHGREAVDMFAAGGHDLILMDLRMPEMDGLEATAAIRALPGGANIPIIAMTANALQQDVDRCLAAGMDDFVPKPVDKARLLETLARHLTGVWAEAGPPGGDVRQVTGATPDLDDPLIDESVIRQLGEDVSEGAVPSMLEMFLSETIARTENLLKALDDSATDVLEDEAHTLKSCAGTFGAARLQALARDIEAACREGNRQAAENLGKGMGELLQQTLAAYRERFDFLAKIGGEG
jgi:PAS domain S-box-containing protein